MLFCATTLVSSQSYATGFFVGADALMAKSSHKAINSSAISGPKNNDEESADNLNFGISAGARFDLLALTVSGELFFDNLQTSSTDFATNDNSNNSGDRIKIKNRYGAKANVGFSVLPKITPFVTYGFSNVNYGSDLSSQNVSLAKSKLTPLYGAGILFDLPFGVSAKASYDYQSFNMQSAESGSKIRTHLGVAKLGLIYNF
jgi:opacity protein-like surface antigen